MYKLCVWSVGRVLAVKFVAFLTSARPTRGDVWAFCVKGRDLRLGMML